MIDTLSDVNIMVIMFNTAVLQLQSACDQLDSCQGNLTSCQHLAHVALLRQALGSVFACDHPNGDPGNELNYCSGNGWTWAGNVNELNYCASRSQRV